MIKQMRNSRTEGSLQRSKNTENQICDRPGGRYGERNMRRIRIICCALALMLCAAGSGQVVSAGQTTGEENTADQGAEKNGCADASFHADQAQGNEQVKLDLSATEYGYVAVLAYSGVRLKFQVIKGEVTYNYDMSGDGTPSVFPIQSGDGRYTFRVLEKVAEGKYAVVYTADCDVKLQSEFEPFLRPSDYVSYDAESDCVKKAAELAGSEESRLGVVENIYDYICEEITYDRELAATVKSGYLPDPDETLATGKGICFDYASLAAAMLRSQGIPVKMVFGYVSPDDLYHAWNMFYTEETGWVTVGYEVSADSWNRLDLTFSANGKDSRFIGDGGNYKDAYYY